MLKELSLIKIDVTNNSKEDEELLKYLNVMARLHINFLITMAWNWKDLVFKVI